MKTQHIALALLVAAVWGFNFVVIQVGLASFPPLLMVALRFVLAALPIFFLPRPAIPWPHFLALATALFIGQFVFLFTGMAQGMPAGLASLTLQAQAFLTVILAIFFLGERITVRRGSGIALALLGLALIASTVGTQGHVTTIGFAFTLTAALSWAIGNVLLRKAGPVDMLPLIVWLSIVPPLPLLLLSYVFEGPHAIAGAFERLNWIGVGSILYLAFLATLLGFGLWGHLLKIYPASVVAPFSLAVPVFGAAFAALLLGERFGPTRLGGMALVLLGLAVVVVPPSWLTRRRAEAAR